MRQFVRSSVSRRAGIWCATALIAASSCASSTPTTLHDYLVDEQAAAGVSVSTEEADCADRRLSAALGMTYPASLADYQAAMSKRLSSLATDVAATATTAPYTSEVLACISPQHLDEIFAAALTNTKISSLTQEQRECLIAAVHPMAGTIPPNGVDPAALRSQCGIPDSRTQVIKVKEPESTSA